MPESIPYTFVVYHTEISPEGVEAIGNIYQDSSQAQWKERWQSFQKDYLPHAADYIAAFFQSARQVHPGSRCVVLTDLSSSMNVPEPIEIVRYPLDPNKPAYNRLLAQKHYLSRSDDICHTVFLDYDMLIQQSLDQIIAYDFDVALTCGTAFTCGIEGKVINGSFILIRKGRKEQGQRYLCLVEELYQEKYTAFQAWGGVQAAMTDLADLPVPFCQPCEIEGVNVAIFPAEQFNFPYSSQEMEYLDYKPDKMILHFKGRKKQAMLEYWNEYLKKR